ncbi:MAG: MBOAT family O-acyltransferase [Bacteroidales bacterium]|jgi:D-alanyl-lipoteichoic acid acyltransferase DltB (MBOAT superfamily)|nr:MBOAT family O-acyltransferase [Bacteroidales bacterium]
MLFNSFEFALFLPVVFLLYWFATGKSLKAQNILLLVASYFFYGSWDYRFLFLLMFSTFLDYFTGIKIHEAKPGRMKTFWLWLSISINLGFLGVFKYFNFFASSFADLLGLFGIQAGFVTLNVILPVGISFYTFHGLSYVLDLYNDRIQPERNYVNYAVFVSFFPLLVAGPIERATHLLPQIIKKREFNYSQAVDGMQQIIWGLFKKVVVADNCAPIVNNIFENPGAFSGSELLIGVVLFAFQIYCDFSGYSDIALGTARLFGITLLRNFAFPYFARDIAEFWRRWHISLTTWFRDYLYIPLGGSRGGKWMSVRNTFIVFLVSGFWHGANWTFIVWGFLNALYFLPLLLMNKNRQNMEIAAKGKWLPSLKDLAGMAVTFSLTLLAWVFFRADSVSGAFIFIRDIFSASLFTAPDIKLHYIWVFIIILLVFEWIFREQQYGLQLNEVKLHKSLKWSLLLALGLIIFIFGNFNKTEFIYFAF